MYPIGCSGVITHVRAARRRPLQHRAAGLERFRIVEEDHTRSYRRGLVDPLAEPEPDVPTIAPRCMRHRAKLESLLAADG